MNKNSVFLFLTVSICLFSPLPVQTDEGSGHKFTANISLVSEYIYRGLAQSAGRPALQGGFDYVHPSGAYLGNWNSSISWLADSGMDVSSAVEMDFYGGFRWMIKALSLDLGGLFYFYPSHLGETWQGVFANPNTCELYAALGWRWFVLKYSHSLTNLFGSRDSAGSGYLEANVTVPLLARMSASLHLGHQWLKNAAESAYTDIKIALSYDAGGVVFGLAFTACSADPLIYSNPVTADLGQERVLCSLSRTF